MSLVTVQELGFCTPRITHLTWKGRDGAAFGDGTACIFDVYMAIVLWDSQYRSLDLPGRRPPN